MDQLNNQGIEDQASVIQAEEQPTRATATATETVACMQPQSGQCKPNPVFGKICHYCKKKNHFQSDCFKCKETMHQWYK
jgi:hypothetical protein